MNKAIFMPIFIVSHITMQASEENLIEESITSPKISTNNTIMAPRTAQTPKHFIYSNSNNLAHISPPKINQSSKVPLPYVTPLQTRRSFSQAISTRNNHLISTDDVELMPNPLNALSPEVINAHPTIFVPEHPHAVAQQTLVTEKKKKQYRDISTDDIFKIRLDSKQEIINAQQDVIQDNRTTIEELKELIIEKNETIKEQEKENKHHYKELKIALKQNQELTRTVAKQQISLITSEKNLKDAHAKLKKIAHKSIWCCFVCPKSCCDNDE